MANSIALFKKYIDLLDEVYKNSAITATLESDATLARQGANANEIVIPKLAMDGLGNYSRNSGYVSGDVTLTNETVAFNYDRGRKFSIDSMDDEETIGVAFGKLSSEFIRTKVVPELDAFRFANLTANAGTTVAGTLSDGSDAVTALQTAQTALDDDEVPTESRVLFISPALLNAIENLDTTKSRAVLSSFSEIHKVPKGRFYTSIDLLDGSSDNETAGGFTTVATTYALTTDTAIDTTKTYYTLSDGVYSAVSSPDVDDIATYYEVDEDGSHALNFLIVEKSAVLQFTKHRVNKAFSPDENQDADAWIFNFREYGLSDVYENKTAGIYAHYNSADVSQAAAS